MYAYLYTDIGVDEQNFDELAAHFAYKLATKLKKTWTAISSHVNMNVVTMIMI